MTTAAADYGSETVGSAYRVGRAADGVDVAADGGDAVRADLGGDLVDLRRDGLGSRPCYRHRNKTHV